MHLISCNTFTTLFNVKLAKTLIFRKVLVFFHDQCSHWLKSYRDSSSRKLPGWIELWEEGDWAELCEGKRTIEKARGNRKWEREFSEHNECVEIRCIFFEMTADCWVYISSCIVCSALSRHIQLLQEMQPLLDVALRSQSSMWNVFLGSIFNFRSKVGGSATWIL